MGAVQPPFPAGTSFTVTDPSVLNGATLALVPTAPSAEPGWQTTEFWVALVTQVIGLLTVTGVVHPSTETVNGIVGLITLVGPAIAYPLARAIRKSGTTA